MKCPLFLCLFLWFAPYFSVGQNPVIHISKKSDIVKYKGVSTDTQSGESLKFDGVGDLITLEHNVSFDSSFSISCWIKPFATGKEQTIFLKGENCPDGAAHFKGITFSIGITPMMNLTGVVFSGEGRSIDERLTFLSNEVIRENTWNHLLIVFNGSAKEWKVFLDNKVMPIQQQFRERKENFIMIANTPVSSWKIGGDENYCNYIHQFTSFLKGELKDVRIFNQKLTAKDADKFYNEEVNSKIFFLKAVLISLLLFAIAIYLLGKMKLVALKLMPHQALVTVILSLLFFFVFQGEIKKENVALFGGDTWEYQSMAVNFALGSGIQKFGALTTFDQYKFDHFDETLFKTFQEEAGRDNFYRTPGYPLFLGIIYKLSGIHPLMAKYIQLLLICIIAGSLPFLGRKILNVVGFVSGLIGGAIFVGTYLYMANELLTEVLFSFFLFLIVWSWILFMEHKNAWTSALVGLVMGVSILIKGSVLFLPFLLVIWIFVRYRKKRRDVMHRYGVLMLVSCMFTILPWSIYATLKSGSTIFLSTETRNVLLDSHNELTTDGDWHPEWRKTNSQRTFYYNTIEIDDKPSFVSVLLFYTQHPEVMLPGIKNKLNRAFSSLPFHTIWAFSLTISLCFVIVSKYRYEKLKKEFIMWSIVGIGFCITNIFLNFVFLLIPLCIVALLNPSIVDRNDNYEAAIIVYLLYFNFLLITLITYGNQRFIEVMNFAFIPLGIAGVLNLFNKVDRLDYPHSSS